MRRTAATANRIWLAVTGIVALLAGIVGILIATGLLRTVGAALGMDLSRPAPADHLSGAGTRAALSITWVVMLVAVAGVVLGLLALAWLIAQIPRTDPARPFRLHDDARDGLTRCDPAVLTTAVETQIQRLPRVHSADAVLRGTAQDPELTVKVTVGERADVPALLHHIQTHVAHDLGQALDTRLSRLAVQVEIGATKTRSHQIAV